MASLDELKELVQGTLEAKGVLGRLKAQLRAAVYTAIDEQERQRGVHLEDPRVSELKEDATCRMATDLVIEFLTFYNLDAALSCLLPEISFSRNDVHSRATTARSVGIDGRSDDAPLLVELLRRGPAGQPSATLADGAFSLGTQHSMPAHMDNDAASDSFDSEVLSPAGRSLESSPAVQRMGYGRKRGGAGSGAGAGAGASMGGNSGFSVVQEVAAGSSGSQDDEDDDHRGDGGDDMPTGNLDGGHKVEDLGRDDVDEALERELAMSLGLADAAPSDKRSDAPRSLSDTVRQHTSLRDGDGDRASDGDSGAGAGESAPKGRGLSRSKALGQLPPVSKPKRGSGLSSLSSLPPMGPSAATAAAGASNDATTLDDPMTPKWFNAPDSPNADRAHAPTRRSPPEPAGRPLSRLQQLDQRLREVEGGDAQPSAATDRVAPPSVPSPADAGSDDDDYGDDDFEDEVSDLDEPLSASEGDLNFSADPLGDALDSTDRSLSASMNLNGSAMFESNIDQSVDSQALEAYDFVEPVGQR